MCFFEYLAHNEVNIASSVNKEFQLLPEIRDDVITTFTLLVVARFAEADGNEGVVIVCYLPRDRHCCQVDVLLIHGSCDASWTFF